MNRLQPVCRPRAAARPLLSSVTQGEGLAMKVVQEQMESWFDLAVGQEVDVYDEDRDVHFRGAIETAAPEIGVLWILTETRSRKLINIEDYVVSPHRDAQSPNTGSPSVRTE